MLSYLEFNKRRIKRGLTGMANKLLKYLNNQIVIWENIYGDYYSMLYDENDQLKPTKNEILQNDLFKFKHAAMEVLLTLRKIKRNRFKDVKRPEKRKYKINWYGRG